MSRPVKGRQICRYSLPAVLKFVPEDSTGAGAVVMTLDEYETVRLLDGEGLTQQECARQMGIARTSVQSIYESARHKLALMLTEGRQLSIEANGSCIICDGRHFCGHTCKFLTD